ncbi:hypothetical protein ARMSODRAFT_334814 [Armillaria solidipes]|uniref:Uncharacterized protein n=1 Tax=Armillaria solidipes TaxID=1076256 RepID=A0A2H3BSZ0_9AGAR|nr:hypothetical protein ARMSODRAFT_334814 [Armillaria solidipes]
MGYAPIILSLPTRIRAPAYTIASRSHKDFASALVINRAGRQCTENVTRSCVALSGSPLAHPFRSRTLGEVPIPDKYRQPWCIIRRAASYGSKRCTLCGRKSHKGGESPVVRVRLIKTYKCSPCIWIAELPKWLHEIIKKKILPWDHSPGDRGQRRTPTGVHIGAVNESASVWVYPPIRRRRNKQRVVVVVVLEIVPWEIARRREDTNAKNVRTNGSMEIYPYERFGNGSSLRLKRGGRKEPSLIEPPRPCWRT